MDEILFADIYQLYVGMEYRNIQYRKVCIGGKFYYDILYGLP